MNNILEYKGYHCKIEYDAGSAVLFGKIEGIRDLVNFESDHASSIEQEFHNAVDDYLAFCEEVGKEPDKEYKGLFNVRIAPELHKKLAVLSSKTGTSLNSIVEISIEQYLNLVDIHDDYDITQSETNTLNNIVRIESQEKKNRQ